MRISPFILLFLLGSTLSCTGERGPLEYSFKGTEVVDTAKTEQDNEALQRELWLKKLKEEYHTDLVNLEVSAKESFKSIEKIVQKKCSDCHDSREKLPFYGRIFPNANPVYKHQKEGLIALDFKDTYPLMAQGNPPQLALLKAIKSSVEERTMPLKSYLLVYPFRRITKKNAKALLSWVNPLIAEHERIQEKYRPLFESETISGKVERLLALKCLRCHGNGNTRGGLGGLEDLEGILKRPKLVNLDNPSESEIYKVCENGEMPTDPKERLTKEELDLLLEWIQEAAQASNL